MPCPLIFTLELFCLEDVTVHETILVQETSQSIKVLMTEKTGSFIRASNEIRFLDIHSKI